VVFRPDVIPRHGDATVIDPVGLSREDASWVCRSLVPDGWSQEPTRPCWKGHVVVPDAQRLEVDLGRAFILGDDDSTIAANGEPGEALVRPGVLRPRAMRKTTCDVDPSASTRSSVDGPSRSSRA
jgi:hypothetical protein